MKKNFIKLVSSAFAAAMAMGTSLTAFAAAPLSNQELETAYENVMSYAEAHGIDLDMTYNDFLLILSTE